jgi:uncharacterized surface protein with fasciclin (FAS1) repeats
MTDLDAHGISVAVPQGWEGRVFRRTPDQVAAVSGAPGPTAEIARAVAHVSTIPLPADTGDFASSAVELLGPNDALIVLFEYDPASAGQPLFQALGMPRTLRGDDFSASMLQRALRGQGGVQRFFQESKRAFCLYVVLGSLANRDRVVPGVNGVLSSFSIADTSSTAPPTLSPASLLDQVALQADLHVLTGLLAQGTTHDLLAGSGPFTLFAPNDDAFATVDLGALRADAAWLDRTLGHHVVEENLPTSVLRQRPTVTPVAGDALRIGATNTSAGAVQLSVDGALIVRPDLVAANGVMHVVTAVLEVPR